MFLQHTSAGRGAVGGDLSVRLAVSAIYLFPDQGELFVGQFAPAHLQTCAKFVNIDCTATVGIQPAEYDARVDGQASFWIGAQGLEHLLACVLASQWFFYCIHIHATL